MRNIKISKSNYTPLARQSVEYVERKGKGHPDTLIDGIVEKFSVELSKRYIEEAGEILHHNVDKALIVGGESETGFGKCRITKPIEVILSGRAVRSGPGFSVPVDDIAVEAARTYLKENTRFLDVDKEVVYTSKVMKGSSDLGGIFKRSADVPLANDTSFGIGFAPFSETEKLVLEAERFLNGAEFKKAAPEVGEDIKVMGVRDSGAISLTISAAMVGNLMASMDDYARSKEKVMESVMKLAKGITNLDVNVEVNTGDDENGEDVYITKSGLSCEAGDDGSVGRGNRVNGIITPFRPMSLEAAAGKNPVNHIGKIYNLLATQIASDVVREYQGVTECNLAIMSQIGKRIDEPLNLNIELYTENGTNFDNARSKAKYVAEGWLENLGEFTLDISLGKYKTF